MNESKEKEQSKPERKFNQEQYDMLKRCSKKKDMTEWNEWRKENPNEEILLEGAKLYKAHLEEANLSEKAHLEGANLVGAHLEGAELQEAYLERAILHGAHLEKAKIAGTHLHKTDFERAIVDGETLIWDCEIDRDTDFTGVALEQARVEPKLMPLLKYNIRRKQWERWYTDHPKLKHLVCPFFWMSDYGKSTGRIILTFFGLAILFAIIYYIWGCVKPPGIIENLFEDSHGPVQSWLVPIRAIYFSIVTMTTLGFGDMYANAHNLGGHLLLIVQVLLGYVLLGALVTRLTVLFTGVGPAGKFTNKEGEGFQDKNPKS